ncbi:MAG: permease, partial [Pseudonocardiaceae bacterium]
ALAKSLFARGADFTASMVFMFASTNLVVELGIVLWLLLGWQFALAEFVGGVIMIALLALVIPRVMSRRDIGNARVRLNTGQDGHAHHGQPGEDLDGDDPAGDAQRQPLTQRIRSRAGWSDAAGYTISDLIMLRKELLIGFIVAGFATVLVPTAVWQSLFLTGHGFWSSLENVVLGPLLAVLAFVCSIGNVPLAAALWVGGISFGGVISFIFADLITLPLLLIYRKYYGTQLTLRLLAVFWAVMSVAGLATEYLFRALGLVPPAHPKVIVMEGVAWNYTTILNIFALAAFAVLYWLYRNRERFGGGTGYAKDPVCGMQVETAAAPATATHDGQRVSFCSDHCQTRFVAAPDRYTAGFRPNR